MGVLGFAPGGDGEGGVGGDQAVLYVLGGGCEARWEMFELLEREGGGWVLVNQGFRRVLGRQFVD